jgi:MFS family permease
MALIAGSGARLGSIEADEGRPVSAAAVAMVAFLGVTAGVQMSDRGLQAILLPAIKHDFGVTDATLGALQGVAGVLVASALAVPLARLADRWSRKYVLLLIILGWTLLTALSALARSFPLFFLGRAASGVTEFAMIPIVYSLIPDLMPERLRVPANLSFAALMTTGASAGFYFGGRLLDLAAGVAAQHPLLAGLETWRCAMLLLASAGILLLAAGCFAFDPPRRTTAAGEDADTPLLSFLIARWRAVGLFVGVAGPLALAVQTLTPLIAMALERRFASDLGTVGHVLGLVTLATGLGCLPLAGWLDRLFARRLGTTARPLIMGLGALAALPCILLLATAGTEQQATVALIAFLFLTCTANVLVPTMLQDLTPAALRARSFAIWSFVVSVFCAVGPLAAGFLSDRLLHGDLLTAIVTTSGPALIVSAICAAVAVASGRVAA